MLNKDYKKILSLSIPAAVSNFFDMIQVLVDMIMLGRVSPEAVAAAGLSMQFLGFLYAVMAFFSVGTSAIISRYVGAKKFEEVSKVIFLSSFIGLIISVPFTLIGIFLPEELFFMMGASNEVVENGVSYFQIISLTIPVIFIEMAIYSSFNAIGDTKTPLKIVLLANLINTILDYLLIFGKFGFPKLGIEGAAIATAISYFLSFFVYIYAINRKVGISPEFELKYVKKILTISVPTGVERVFTYFSFLLFVKLIADYGTNVLAGYQIGLRIEGLAFMPGFGFTIAAMTLVGQSLGASDPDKAQRLAWQTTKIASLFMGMMGVFMVLTPEYLVMVFTEDREVIQEASIYLKIVGLTQVPLAISFVLSGALRGAGATKTTMIVNSISLWFFRIIPAYILSKIFKDVIWIYYAMFFETYAKAGILYLIFKTGKWKEKKI
ncbi:MAG: MATE family efflux transporter [Hydrogenothermaceae bacterium]|nr:MATE family efflux transporter [Hydrogenothermaceae bacterium]